MEQASLGHRLRALRKAKRFTQAKLAERAQISERSIVYWETDRHLPRRHELQALLNTLEVSFPDQAQLLLALTHSSRKNPVPCGNILQQTLPNTPLPGAGDLLRALRARRGVSREEEAQTLGVAVTTWWRWENHRTAIPLAMLPRIRTLLQASAGENQALESRMALPLDDSPVPLEQAQEWPLLFARGRNAYGAETVDLDAFALQRKLWLLHMTYPEARTLFARVSLDYSAWLLGQNRLAEATAQAQQALRLYAQDADPELSIAGPLNILSLCASLAPGDEMAVFPTKPERGLRLLNRWLPQISHPFAQGMVLSDAGLYAAEGEMFDLTERYFDAARSVLTRVGEEQAALHLYLRVSYAKALLFQRRPVEAVNALPFPIPDPADTVPGDDPFQFLIYVRFLLALGERHKAEKWLSNIYAHLTQREFPRLRTIADSLQRQL
jgi:transcriptional regulator with XRE-family HTH domain